MNQVKTVDHQANQNAIGAELHNIVDHTQALVDATSGELDDQIMSPRAALKERLAVVEQAFDLLREFAGDRRALGEPCQGLSRDRGQPTRETMQPVLIKEPFMASHRRIIQCAFILLLASILGCASTPTREGTGEYIDDSAITAKVKAAVLQEATLKSAEINVETFKGVVQLSGFVASRASINTAGTVARGVEGVKAVRNDIRIKGQE